MVVGVARLKIRLADNHSLKGKRRVIKSLIDQVCARFRVSISEVAAHDMWQWAEIGISTVGNSQPIINSVLDNILNFIEDTCPVEIVETDIEIIHLGG